MFSQCKYCNQIIDLYIIFNDVFMSSPSYNTNNFYNLINMIVYRFNLYVHKYIKHNCHFHYTPFTTCIILWTTLYPTFLKFSTKSKWSTLGTTVVVIFTSRLAVIFEVFVFIPRINSYDKKEILSPNGLCWLLSQILNFLFFLIRDILPCRIHCSGVWTPVNHSRRQSDLYRME